MTKKEDYSLLKNCPQKFDVNNYNLGILFGYAAMGIDNYMSRRINEFSEEEYLAVRRVGKILYQYGNEQKNRDYDNRFPLEEDIFLANIFKELGKNMRTVKDITEPIIELGLNFIKMKELSKEKHKELINISLLFSRKARNYWQVSNPYGFKKYVA